MGLLGNMQQYAQYQAASAIEQSAKNPGGGNSPLEFGVGMAMGQQMANTMKSPVQSSTPNASTPPPPPLGQTQWYISRDGQSKGPFNWEQLRQQNLTAQTYVWRAGMDNWQYASEIAELASLLPATPPPPMQAQWYISRNGEQSGPFNLNQLSQANLTSQTYVWRAGMDDWQQASAVSELASVISSPPPAV